MGVVDCSNVIMTPGKMDDALPRITADGIQGNFANIWVSS
jgi:hypothetical protein